MELTRRVALYRVAEDSILSVLSSVDSVKELNKHYSKVIPRLSQAYKYKIKLLTDDLIASSNRDKWANRFVTSAVLYPSLNLLEVKPLHNIGINAAVIAVQWLFDYELFNLFHVSDSVKRLIL